MSCLLRVLCAVKQKSLRPADPSSRRLLRRVTVRDIETSRMRWPWPALGCCVREIQGLIKNFAINMYDEVEVHLRTFYMKASDLQGGSNMTGTNCDLFTHK
jgi:hypothetical protein